MYKVFRVSENSNSFGLKQFYAMNKDGETFKACKGSQFAPKIGDMVYYDGSFELREYVGVAPAEAVKEIFN